MESRKPKKILAVIIIVVAFLLATIIITNSIINSFNLVEDEHTPMMSYETYTVADNMTYTPTSEDSYTVNSKQTISNNLNNNDSSIIENSINSSANSATSFLSSAASTNSSKSTQSQKNESVSSSISYNASSKKESQNPNTKKEETTQQQVEKQIPVHEHNYIERVISPNCTSKGYTLHSCECGKSYADNYTNALGHQWGDWETISEATVTSKGLQQKICQRCSAKDYRYIDKLEVKNSPNSEFSEKVIKLINEERKKNGVSPLKIDYTLMNNAYTRSTELETNFGHQRPNGEQGYTFALDLDYSIVGENIAAGQTTPEEVVNAWMNSTGHRSNILNPEFTHTGVGCYMANDGWIYWTQLFGG